MWSPFLAHMQTFRVLLTIYLPHLHVPNPYVLRLCHKNLKLKLAPTPGTALQQKIESKLEKSLGTQFNIQLQQMGVFQASMLEAMKSLRDEMQSMKKSAKTVELDQSFTSASKPGPSKQSDKLPPNSAPNTH